MSNKVDQGGGVPEKNTGEGTVGSRKPNPVSQFDQSLFTPHWPPTPDSPPQFPKCERYSVYKLLWVVRCAQEGYEGNTEGLC